MKHVLLLHGAIGSAAQLEPLKENLNGSFHLHLLNFPGHGGSSMPLQFSISFFADYVQQYCVAHQLTRVSIFGYSMGGYVGLYLARQNPGLVEKLVTLATKFHWDEAIAAREVKMLQPEVIEQKLPQFAATLQQRHAPNDWKQVLQMTGNMLRELGSANALQREGYAAISTPALIMLGDRDKMVGMEETIAVYRQLPQAQLAFLPATPHPIEQVDTSLVGRLVQGFLG